MALFIPLYIVNFFRTLVIIAIIYYAIRLISRYLLPFLLENKMRDMQQKMQQQEEQKKRAGKRDGEVTIEYQQKKNNIRNHNEGEYVDFEEVD